MARATAHLHRSCLSQLDFLLEAFPVNFTTSCKSTKDVQSIAILVLKRFPHLKVVHVATYKEGEKEPGYWDDVDTNTHKVRGFMPLATRY